MSRFLLTLLSLLTLGMTLTLPGFSSVVVNAKDTLVGKSISPQRFSTKP